MTRPLGNIMATAVGAALLLGAMGTAASDRDRRHVEPNTEASGQIRRSPGSDRNLTGWLDSTRSAAAPSAGSASQDEIGAAGYQFDWYSLNGGGTTTGSSSGWSWEASAGQQLAGLAVSTNYSWDVGFWYGLPAACPIILPGDVNASGTVTTGDIIHLVNFVLKLGAEPEPCVAAGDVNCDGNVVTSDIIYLVNLILKAGPAVCDQCALIPGTWSCP